MGPTFYLLRQTVKSDRQAGAHRSQWWFRVARLDTTYIVGNACLTGEIVGKLPCLLWILRGFDQFPVIGAIDDEHSLSPLVLVACLRNGRAIPASFRLGRFATGAAFWFSPV